MASEKSIAEDKCYSGLIGQALKKFEEQDVK